MNESAPQKNLYWLMQPLLLAVVLVVGFLFGIYFQTSNETQVVRGASHTTHLSSYHKLGEILNFVQTKYVDSVDIDYLADVAAKAILKELDPHSYYIPRKEAEAVTNRMQGNMEGVGIEFFVFQDTVYIIDLVPGSPAAESSLKKGDIIVTINDSLVSGVNRELSEIVEFFRGPESSFVAIDAMCSISGDKYSVELLRRPIPLSSLGASYLVEEGLLYVKINSFTSRTYSEFMETIEDYASRETGTNLILDLRHNPGGYLQEAIKILSQFVAASGKPLVRTKGASTIERTYRSTGRRFFNVDKIVVLIDGASASASEIIAGVLQDLDRGVVIGNQSFGKGSVQEHFVLNDNSAVRLTVSQYFMPSGRGIFKNEFAEKSYDDLEKFSTPNGRYVTQGQAIVPDIIVEPDSLFSHANFNQTLAIVNRLAFSYFINNLSSVESPESLISESIIPHNWLEDLLLMAESQEEKQLIEDFYNNDNHRLHSFLNARVGRFFFGDDIYFQLLNETDPVFNTAVEVIQNGEIAGILKSRR